MDRELLECAKINFENVEKSAPQIKANPFYIIAKSQLDEALGYKETILDSVLRTDATNNETAQTV